MLPRDTALDLFDIGTLPFYSEDLEREALPESVREFRARIAEADGMIVATPEYNRTYSGVLKNALEWASRPHGQAAIMGKPVLVVGASTGMSGAVNAQTETRALLARLGADVIEDEVRVAHAGRVFDAAGHLTDDLTRYSVRNALEVLVERASREYTRAA